MSALRFKGMLLPLPFTVCIYNEKVNKRWDVLGIGSAAVDDAIYLDEAVVPDKKIPIREMYRRNGGQTATALVTAARHGASTAFYSCLGDDELSRFTLDAMRREGIDDSLVFPAANARPFHSIILINRSTGSRTILYSDAGVCEPDPQYIEPDWVRSCRVLLIDQNTPRSALHAVHLARQHGIPVVGDLEYKPSPELAELTRWVDHLIVGIDFAQKVTREETVEDMLRALVNPDQAACIITGGEQGCWYRVPGQKVMHVPAFPVHTLDTTGCGDVFHGAYAAALARNEPVHRAVKIASAAAAIKATCTGGWAAVPSLIETMSKLSQPNC